MGTKKGLTCFIAGLLSLFLFVLPVQGEQKTGFSTFTTTTQSLPPYKDGEVLIKYKSGQGVTVDSAQAMSSENWHKLIRLDQVSTQMSVAKIDDGKSVADKVKELQNDPLVEYAQPNYQYRESALGTNDTYASSLWGLDNTGQSVNGTAGTNDADIDGPQAWSQAGNSIPAVTVAVIDLGVAYNHPDLLASMWDGSSCLDDQGAALGGCQHGYDFEDNDKIPLPTSSDHGTHVAGIIAAQINNSIGVAGIASNARIMALKTDLSTAQIVQAIHFAGVNGAKVINASFGGYGDVSIDQAMYNAIAGFPGLFVAAAGNSAYNHDLGGAYVDYPAGFKSTSPAGPGLGNVIVVAASNSSDQLSSFSDYGATTVDLAAPGQTILSTVPDIAVTENFESVTPPGLGTYFTQTGSGTWATYHSNITNNTVLYSDASYPNYRAGVDSILTSNAMSYGGGYIKFDYRCDIALISATHTSPDYLEMQASANGTTWGVLGFAPSYGSGTTTFDLSNYAGSAFRVRFVWHTDAAGGDKPNDACYIDNLNLYDTAAAVGSYVFKDGTSMATPYVAGTVAMMMGMRPDLSASNIKTALLQTGDVLASLSSKVIGGKRLNAYQAVVAAQNMDVIPPTLSFTDNVAQGPVLSDTIAASWGDASVKKWKYNINTTCSVSASDYDHVDSDSMNQTDQTHDGQYLCLYGEDASHNASELASAYPINIDITKPVITIHAPDSSLATTKTITASANKGTLTQAVTTGAVCDATLTFGTYQSLTFSNVADNGKRVCYYAFDSLGNHDYQLSVAIAGIAAALPVIQITDPTLTPAHGKVVSAVVNYGTLMLKVLANKQEDCSGSGFIDQHAIVFTAESDNGKVVCFRATDGNGNSDYLPSAEISGIDYTRPQLLNTMYSTTEPTLGPVVVTVTANEPVTMTNNGGSFSYSFTQNGNFTFSMMDVAGNSNDITVIVSNIKPLGEVRAYSFVKRMYTRVLGRNADPNGLSYWENRLLSGQATKLGIIRAYLNTEEDYRNYVQNIYHTFMQRDADPAGLSYWTTQMLQGLSKTDLIANFVDAPEFLDQNTTSFMQALYLNFMNRAGEPNGMAYWTSVINDGVKTKQQVIRDFFISYEFNAKYVQEQYQQILERGTDSAGEQYFVSLLQQGMDRLRLTSILLDSDEFWNK